MLEEEVEKEFPSRMMGTKEKTKMHHSIIGAQGCIGPTRVLLGPRPYYLVP